MMRNGPHRSTKPGGHHAPTDLRIPARVRAMRRRIGHMPASFLASLLMVAAGLAAGCMLGGIRAVSDELHPLQIAFFRNFFGFLVIAPWFMRQGLAVYRTERLNLHAFRGVLNVIGTFLFVFAVAITPLAEVASLGFVSPIFATLFAALFLGERVGPRRWVAVALGFLGALIIVRPGLETIHPGTLMLVTAAALWALVLMVVKVLGRTDSAVTITAYEISLLTAFSLVPALFVWQWLSASQLLWLVFVGVIGTLSHMAVAHAFRLADASALMPLEFLKLVWAALIGYAFFAEVPVVWTWLGAAIIVSSTTYIAIREARARRRPSTGGKEGGAPKP